MIKESKGNGDSQSNIVGEGFGFDKGDGCGYAYVGGYGWGYGSGDGHERYWYDTLGNKNGICYGESFNY